MRRLDSWPVGLDEPASTYPWDQILDGTIWELNAGEDFKIKAESMRTAAQDKARRRGGRVRTALINNKRTLLVQYIPPGKPEAEDTGWEDSVQQQAVARPTRAERDREEGRAIRTWARAHGWPDLPDLGRLPGEILAAYEQAHTDNGGSN